MTSPMNRNHFAESVNTTFHFKPYEADGEFDLELVEMNDLRSPDGYEAFSLIFRGPSDRIFPQMTYAVRGEQLDEFPLFIVPIGRDENGITYQAIFNRKLDR